MFECPLCATRYGDPRSAEECQRIDAEENREARKGSRC